MSSLNKKQNKNNNNGRKKSRSQTLNQHLLQMTDLELNLADGSVLPRADAFEVRQQSNTPPLQVPRNIAQQLFWAKFMVTTSFNTSNSVETDRGYAFHLNDFGQYTHYSALFDQYSVVCVVATIGSTYNTSLAGVGATPRLYTAIDHDDVSPCTISALTLNPGTKVTRIYQKQTRMIYPRAATAAYSGAFSSFSNQRTWIDAASPSVEHYGLKVCVETDLIVSVVDVDLAYYVVFRNVHNA